MLAALAFGGVPLVIGCGIFLLWIPTRWGGLEAAGMLNIFVGVLSVLIGVLCLIAFACDRIASGNNHVREWSLALLALVVMGANFPVCAIILEVVGDLQIARWQSEELSRLNGQSSVRIVNASDQPIAVGLAASSKLKVEPGKTELMFFEFESISEVVVIEQSGVADRVELSKEEENLTTDDVIIYRGPGDVDRYSFRPQVRYDLD